MFFIFPVRDEYGVKRFPFAVLSLIIINCVVFFISFFSPYYHQIIMEYGFIPSRFSFRNIFTSMFLHGSLLHLGFNMWYLWLLGDNIEDRWGRLNFLIFYFMAGIFATILYSSIIPERYRNIPIIGASGAISGILGAYAVLFPKSRITFKYFYWVFLKIGTGEFEIYSYLWLTFWFLQQAVYTLLVAKSKVESSVAFAAHFSGFIFGMIVAFGTKIFKEAKYRENVMYGKNALINLLGKNPEIERSITEKEEIEKAKREIIENIEEDRVYATKIYEKLIKKYPEVTLPEKIQIKISQSLERQGKFETALLSYRNFVLNYPFSKLADNALFSLGKIFLQMGDYEKAKNSFLQIVLFYPYSDVYEEAKFYLEKKLPETLKNHPIIY